MDARRERDERLEATVAGRVQGVGFRWFVQRHAARLELRGWVANRADGTVRVIAEGPVDRLDALEDALRTGPAGAHVERVHAERSMARGEREFRVRSGDHAGD